MMDNLSLSSFEDDTITLNFAVPEHGIDAYTLADSLVAFSDFARAIDRYINPGQQVSIEVVVLSPGSVKAHLRRLSRGSSGFFSDGAKQIFWGVVSGVLTFWLLGGDPEIVINIDGDDVVITSGSKTFIVTRDVYTAAKAVAMQEEVSEHGRRLFQVLESDPEIEALTLEAPDEKEGGGLRINRGHFGRLVRETRFEPPKPSRRRTERARLVITKPSFHKKLRKWSFEWNGVPVSASISDAAFVETLQKRGFLFGYGDVLEVEISYVQKFNAEVGDYLNDTSSYEVTKVFRHVPSTG
ncbi:MAG TPA: hypothetical protein VL017_04595 [Devosia sp.]|nr:hypothetical protein [Devosia sp.]